jgi:hypothetical protein
MEEQVKHGWPGLVSEVSKLTTCCKWRTSKNRVEYAKDVKTAYLWQCEASRMEKMEGKKGKKMTIMYHNNMELEGYIKTGDLHSARTT